MSFSSSSHIVTCQLWMPCLLDPTTTPRLIRSDVVIFCFLATCFCSRAHSKMAFSACQWWWKSKARCKRNKRIIYMYCTYNVGTGQFYQVQSTLTRQWCLECSSFCSNNTENNRDNHDWIERKDATLRLNSSLLPIYRVFCKIVARLHCSLRLGDLLVECLLFDPIPSLLQVWCLTAPATNRRACNSPSPSLFLTICPVAFRQ